MLFELLTWILPLFVVTAVQESVIFFRVIFHSRMIVHFSEVIRAKELYDKSLSLLLQNQREGKEMDYSRLNECQNAIRVV